ncbi:PREDICTED: uncharacterized protein LOC104825977 isoform X2 [Tarenaya hassleriana]|uniref:uncharacterized protein LOC104825977 isoform X2 n=1 Tax=Tarenaya hassleriana TaxID=28532 RepID=UPI00053C46C5|nr:PREDICTED: uncharacterized protein LOC104825977 isoform X2 [Tarenaya hassleriana]
MWRRSNIPGNRDSDQSISEEDEEYGNGDFGGNDMSPSGNSREEGGLLLQTRLENLIGCGEVNYASQTGNLSPEASSQKSLPLEDDVEVPDSQEESNFAPLRKPRSTCISDAESVSDDEIPQYSKMTTWSTVTKETKALIHLNGDASFSLSRSSGSKTKRCNKVVKDQVRRKFSFHSHTHGEMSSKINGIPENLETCDQVVEEDPIADCLHGFDEETENRDGVTVSASRVIQYGCADHAISKLLDSLPDTSRATKRSVDPYCRRRRSRLKYAHKGSSSTLQDRATDDELPGPMDSESSSDYEPRYQSSVPDTRNQKKKFLGDQFNEALKAASLSNGGQLFTSPYLSGCGLYGKLQQVIKREREEEMEILKTLQVGVGQRDAWRYVDVRILSRGLEARLVVCKCSAVNDVEDSPLLKNSRVGKETTIIFSTKVCSDVDIEVGSVIRIYSPWKEVELKNKNKEVIILCSYFSIM